MLTRERKKWKGAKKSFSKLQGNKHPSVVRRRSVSPGSAPSWTWAPAGLSASSVKSGLADFLGSFPFFNIMTSYFSESLKS